MSGRALLAMGESAFLVECRDNVDARSVAAAVMTEARAIEGLADVVPAARTVLVTFTNRRLAADAVSTLRRLAQAARAITDDDAGVVRIPTRYDGPDLDLVAASAGLSRDEVVELHSRALYDVAFLGFVPGFAYLTGLPAQLETPRRSDPRTRVPSGSVGVAGDMTAIYPRSGPGGWQLIGCTDLRMFDATHDPPSLLTAGAKVRFVPA
jgi:KipI family sensor histidine kinase inhibitor